tara:strand:- start:304 stop:756 length:453 start_codon:yes stop_codon:yes gene_type:complete
MAVNKVILVGNLGNDPEVRYTNEGAAIANLSLATSDSWKDKKTGEKKEKTEWHRIVMFNRLGEIAGEYLKKGSKIYLEGSLRTRKWTDQSGQDKYTTEIVAREMQMLDGKSSAAIPRAAARAITASKQLDQQGTSPTPPPLETFEDDIPF